VKVFRIVRDGRIADRISRDKYAQRLWKQDSASNCADLGLAEPAKTMRRQSRQGRSVAAGT
jgi:hypothetical protein